MVRRGHAFDDERLGERVVAVGEAVGAGVVAASVGGGVAGEAVQGFPGGEVGGAHVGDAETPGGVGGFLEGAEVRGGEVEESEWHLFWLEVVSWFDVGFLGWFDSRHL